MPLRTRSPHALFSPFLLVFSSAAGCGLYNTVQAIVAAPAGYSDVGARDGMRAHRWASQGARGAVCWSWLCRARAPCVCCMGRVDRSAEAAVGEVVGSHESVPLGLGALYARDPCCTRPSWPRLAMARPC